ncbi:helix-turn-helix transcriptional regulator [Desulfosporosinus sp. FKA]|uniref:helix-turn-helix transcriptional regulator n=1 Tax=Desulfosporosinus sp. FKA TaxID=1969834 RepID=UPI000B49A134|nr:helix-turn-helix transcriptional regulator [Desulfosporosinus sp. FKA]
MSELGKLTEDELNRLKQIRAGECLASLRTERNLTQKTVASKLGVSFQYLSEIEKGNKSPSDQLLYNLVEIYDLGLEGEVDLFNRYSRVPIFTAEELKDQESTQLALAELRRLVKTGKITDEQRQELYDEFSKVYRDFMARVLPQNGDGEK